MKKITTAAFTVILPCTTALLAEDLIPNNNPANESTTGSVAEVMPGNTPDEGFSFHGYFRSGLGFNSKGTGMERFLDSRVGRLGNEDSTYGELSFVQTFHSTDTGVWMRIGSLLAFDIPQQTDWEATELSVRELYSEIGGLFDNDAVIIIGKRFYKRKDVHITDFYYNAMTGPTAGIYNLPVGDAEGSIALHYRGLKDEFTIDGTTYEGTSGTPMALILDSRLEGIQVGGKHALEAQFNIGWGGDGKVSSDGGATEVDYDGYFSVSGSLELTTPVNEGFNKASLQVSYGSLDPFNFPNTPAEEMVKIDGTTSQDAGDNMMLRFIDFAVYPITKDWDFAGTIAVEYFEPGDDALAAYNVRTDIVLRPTWYMNQHWSLAFEPGISYFDGLSYDGDALGKLTVAVQAQASRDFWARPVLRAFVTYAAWDDRFKDAVGPAYDTDNAGLNIGLQTEAWW